MKWLYEFTPGGTYIRESGSYRQEPGALTLMPTRSVTEVWTKRQDKKTVPDQLRATQPNPLSHTRYRPARHDWAGQREWNLVLMPDQETLRDPPLQHHGRVIQRLVLQARGT